MVLKLALLIAIAGLVIFAHLTGRLYFLMEPEAFKALLLDGGVWGYGVFLACFTFIQPMGVPGFVFIIAAALVWPKPVAFALSMLGSMGAAIVGFSFARFIARDWARKHLSERFHRFDDRLAQHALPAVIMVYLVFFLAPPAHWALGLSKVNFRPFLIGAFLGFLPGNAAIVFLGGPLAEWLYGQPGILWVLAGSVIIAVLLIHNVLSRHKRARLERTSKDGPA